MKIYILLLLTVPLLSYAAPAAPIPNSKAVPATYQETSQKQSNSTTIEQKLKSGNFSDYKSLLSSEPSHWYDALLKRPYAFHALRSDPRVSYTAYIPEAGNQKPDDFRLLVVVHGSGRNATEYMSAFKTFADKYNFVLLAPLFPTGIQGDGFADGYKNLKEGNIRYDLLLLDMISDVGTALQTEFKTFSLYGFSGGGQFAHRFFYLHPERLVSVSIGAPGLITPIDNSRNWPFGTKNIEDLFGKTVQIESMQKTQVQLLVGEQDTKEFKVPEKYKTTVKTIFGDIGKNRIERLRILQEGYTRSGINTTFTLIPDAAHEGQKAATYVTAYLSNLYYLHDIMR